MNNFLYKLFFYKKNRYVVLAIIVFFPAALFAQQSKETIDSLEMRLKLPTLSESEVFLTYKAIVSAYIPVDFEKTKEYVRKGIRWAEKKNNDFYIAELYEAAGDAYYYSNYLDSALYYYEQSFAKLPQTTHKKADYKEETDLLQISLFTSIGMINYFYGRYALVLDNYLQALDIAEKTHQFKSVARICLNTAITYTAMSNTFQAEKYYLKGEQIFRELNDSIGLSDAYRGLSRIYYDREDYAKALEYAETAYRILSTLYEAPTSNLMEVAQQLAGVWIKLADYDKALQYARQTVEYARQNDNPASMASALFTLANCYLKQEKYREAEEIAIRALEVDSTNIYTNSILFQTITISNIWLKNSEKAIEYYSKSMNAIRAYSNKDFQASISEMEVKYETGKKELQITALKEEKRLMTWLIIAIGGVLLSGFTALFFLWRWAVQKRHLAEQQHELTEARRKQVAQQHEIAEARVNQLIQEQQFVATQAALDGEMNERVRLSHDLHDGLGSMLTSLKLNLELWKGSTSFDTYAGDYYNKAMKILNASMVEMRRVAHHLMPDKLSHFGLKTALSDFFSDIPSIQFEWSGNDDRLDDPKKEVMIYRIIHELVNNALKHSGATKISVNVIREPDYIALTVCDNGCGFDLETESKGMGLSNIRNRLIACNGHIDVNSTVGKGTKIYVEVRFIEGIALKQKIKEDNDIQLIRVALVDDHKMLTDSLRAIIEKEERISVIATASTIAECRKMLETSQPDVLLLDVNLPDGNGLDLCQEIRKHYPDVKILILTSYAETNVIGRALNAGAHGYVLKNSSSEEIVEGILTVAEGKRFLCDQTLILFDHQTFQPVSLSQREREVLKLIVEGATIKEISEKLFLGFETVRSYHKYLHIKLDVHNTAQLVRKALEEKLV